MSDEKQIIRDVQKQMREKLRGEMRENRFQPKQARVMCIALIATVLAALVFFVVEFLEYMPFYPKDAYTQKQCTVISIDFRSSGRSGDYKTTWQAEDGALYTMTASRQDYVGRTETIYTKTLYTNHGIALRMYYEIPRDYGMWALSILCISAMLIGEIWWLIKYKQHHAKGEEP